MFGPAQESTSMELREVKQVLAAHLASHGLKRSAQREAVLEAFLRAGRHVSVEELLAIVRGEGESLRADRPGLAAFARGLLD
jgi:Fe2+ or Zn2+ uptake regulation protein